ncbi:MAG: SIS domain-containing protein [bacterium]|nr:SIS domain-containing protein [bacterium]
MVLRDKNAVQAAGKDLLDRIDIVMGEADWSGFVALADMLPQAGRTFVAGAGRSGLVARSFAMRLMHAGLPAFVPGETATPAAGAGDLLVAVSCTGTTGYTAYLSRRARELGAKVVVLTAEIDSDLAEEASKVILVPARGDNIVVRAAVFEHSASLCLDAVFNILVDRLELDQDSLRQRHANLE